MAAPKVFECAVLFNVTDNHTGVALLVWKSNYK